MRGPFIRLIIFQTAGLAELSVKTPNGFLSPALTMNKEMSPSHYHGRFYPYIYLYKYDIFI